MFTNQQMIHFEIFLSIFVISERNHKCKQVLILDWMLPLFLHVRFRAIVLHCRHQTVTHSVHTESNSSSHENNNAYSLKIACNCL